ncbi:UNVERIFIED_CONTAM: hypothetical protein RMT77_002127 [Armadillidium vulgare]
MDKIKNNNRPHRSQSSRLKLRQENLNVLEQKNNLSIEECFLRQKECEMVPPDGGWGFLVIVGCFVTSACSMSPSYCFTILYSPIFKSDISSSKIAWIMSFRQIVNNFTMIFVGPLCAEFGWRKVAIVGGILNFNSFFLSAFITNPDFLFFSFGFLGGISVGVGISLTYIVISRYFLKLRDFALATATLGSCFASFVSPITANYLLEIYGLKGACLIFGALHLNQCVAGILFQPVEWHLKRVNSSNSKFYDNEYEEKVLRTNQEQINFKPKNKEEISLKSLTQDEKDRLSKQNKMPNPVSYPSRSSLDAAAKNIETSLAISGNKNDTFKNKTLSCILYRILVSTYNSIFTLKYMRVQIVCIGASCLALGFTNFHMWIPLAIRNAGYSMEQSAWCVSISSVTNAMGRILMSLISDRKWFNMKYGYMFSTFLVGLSIIVFSTTKEMKLFIVSICSWSLGIGISYSLGPIVFMSTVGVQTFPAVLGVSALSVGLCSITFGPIVGIIHDATSSYTYALSFLGGLVLIGVVAWIFMPLAIKYDNKISLRETSKGINENA